ncbi:MAG: hypothetical protein AB7U61_07935, partial [Methylocystis sp.]
LQILHHPLNAKDWALTRSELFDRGDRERSKRQTERSFVIAYADVSRTQGSWHEESDDAFSGAKERGFYARLFFARLRHWPKRHECAVHEHEQLLIHSPSAKRNYIDLQQKVAIRELEHDPQLGEVVGPSVLAIIHVMMPAICSPQPVVARRAELNLEW